MATKLKTFLRLMVAMLLAFSLMPVAARPAAALDISQYFTYTYSVQFSKSQVGRGEIVLANVQVTATFNREIPLVGAPSAASTTGRIVAVDSASGTKVTLNPTYTVAVNPFPGLGQTTRISQQVPLEFPMSSPLGNYEVIGEVIKAEVKVPIIDWIDVTKLVPTSKSLGTITYIGDNPPSVPATPPPLIPVATPTQTAGPTPTPSSGVTPTAVPTSTQTPPPSATPGSTVSPPGKTPGTTTGTTPANNPSVSPKPTDTGTVTKPGPGTTTPAETSMPGKPSVGGKSLLFVGGIIAALIFAAALILLFMPRRRY